MDCEQLERRWIREARKALGRSGLRSGRPPVGSRAQPAWANPVATLGGMLPLSSFIEAYHDYHG